MLRRGARRRPDLAGRHVVVTAGGTREPLDPVRFLGNRSSGKQGYAFARTAVARGARVTLIAANVALPDPAGVDVVRVGTTEELRKATLEAAAERRRRRDGGRAGRLPAGRRTPTTKIKKSRRRLRADASSWPPTRTSPPSSARASAPARCWWRSRPRPTTRIANARAKLARKRADLIVVNEVGVGQGLRPGRPTRSPCSARTARPPSWPQAPKEDIADAVWDLVVARAAGDRDRPAGLLGRDVG